jgi:thiol-disulfide isomerase/thioredoxin
MAHLKSNLRARRLLFAAALLLWSCSPPQPQPSGDAHPLVGKPAPGFRLPDLSGYETSLEQYRGKLVLVDFWATWCGPCRVSMPIVDKLQAEHPDDLVLLAVNLQEDDDKVRRYVERQHLRARVLLDRDGRVGGSYGIRSIPMQILIDKTGTIRHVQVGLAPRLAENFAARIEELK